MPPHSSRQDLPFSRGTDRGAGTLTITDSLITGPPGNVAVSVYYGMVTGDEVTYGAPAQVTVGTEPIPGWVILVPQRELYWRTHLEPETPRWLSDLEDDE